MVDTGQKLSQQYVAKVMSWLSRYYQNRESWQAMVSYNLS